MVVIFSHIGRAGREAHSSPAKVILSHPTVISSHKKVIFSHTTAISSHLKQWFSLEKWPDKTLKVLKD